MVTLADRQYTLDDFKRIEEEFYSNEPLPQSIQDMINLLSSKVGAPSYSKTPNFKKNRRIKSRYDTENWETIRNFKATKLERKTEGIEKLIDDIILLLNKITKKNYKDMRDAIINIMKQIDADNEKQLVKVGESIFLIGSSNDFFSHLYATLYKDLILSFPFMETICMKNFESFYCLFEDIEYINADEDYDKFCEINKINEKRRSLGSFFVHLMMLNIIDIKLMVDLLMSLINKQVKHLDNKKDKNIVDEISENIFIIITLGSIYLQRSDKWEKIYSYIKKMSLYKSGTHEALTNKTIFKFMDIMETI